MDLEASHLEELFAYQNLSMGTKQPSLLRDARKLRQEALAALDEALKIDPSSSTVIRRKGDILLQLGRIDEAVKLFAAADSMAPAEPRWYFRTAGQLELLNRLSAAADLLASAAADPASMPQELRAVACVELGSLYLRLDKLEEAENAYRQAQLLSGGRPSGAPTALGRALAASLEEDPTAIRRMLVSVLKRRGKLDDALAEARAALEEAPSDPRTVLTLTGVLEARGDHDGAVATMERFVHQNPASQVGVLALMNLLASAGRADDAVDRAKAFLAANGKDARIEQEAVALYRRAGRPADAEKFALSLEESGALDAPVAESLLELYAADKRIPDAFALAAKTLQANASDPKVASDVYGVLWTRLGPGQADAFFAQYSSEHPDDLSAAYGYAKLLRSKGELEKSGDVFVELARRDASFDDVYEAAALRLVAKGDPYEAAVLFLNGVERGLVSQPDSTAAQILQGASAPADLAARLQSDEAHYKSAVFTLYGMIARLYSAAGDDARAEGFYRKALESPAQSLADYAGLVVSLYRQDKNAEAIDLLNTLKSQGQGLPPLLRMLVAMLSKDGKFDQARALALELIRSQPTDVDNHVALVNLCIEQEDYAGALSELNIAGDLAEGDGAAMINVRYLLGIVYEEQDKNDLALSMWRANLVADPSDADSNNAIAYHIAERGGDLQEALALIQKALAAEPENGAYLDTLGWVYYKMGDLDASRDTLEKAAVKESDPIMLDHLGDVLAKKGDAQGALKAWNEALSRKPKPADRVKIEEKIKANPPVGPGE
jgi:tetratricopeptide (TPR) repeat protein